MDGASVPRMLVSLKERYMAPGWDCWLMLKDCWEDGCDCEPDAMVKSGRRGRGWGVVVAVVGEERWIRASGGRLARAARHPAPGLIGNAKPSGGISSL